MPRCPWLGVIYSSAIPPLVLGLGQATTIEASPGVSAAMRTEKHPAPDLGHASVGKVGQILKSIYRSL